MSIYTNIDSLLNISIDTRSSAQEFLNKLTSREQEQIIDAMYLGRDHIHHNKIREENLPINDNRLNHIPNEDFARILSEKGRNVDIYLKKIVECAKASNIDLNKI